MALDAGQVVFNWSHIHSSGASLKRHDIEFHNEFHKLVCKFEVAVQLIGVKEYIRVRPARSEESKTTVDLDRLDCACCHNCRLR